MKIKSTITYSTVFLLIVIASVLILHQTNHLITTNKKDTLDTFVNQATFLEFNEQGELKRKIQASQMTHYNTLKTTFFSNPQVLTYSNNHTPWLIEADQGKSDDNGSQLILSQNVVIQQLSLQSQLAETTIKTTMLTLFPKLEEVTSKEMVTIARQGTLIQGKGFIAHLKTGQYQLLSESEGIYDPNNKSS